MQIRSNRNARPVNRTAVQRVAVWSNGSGLAYINNVTLRRARLVLGWVTVGGYSASVCNQP